MTTDNWQQFKNVFQAALELPPEKRFAYLYGVCPEPSSRAELEALLLCYQANPRRNEEGTATPNTAQSTPADPFVESFVDHYHIVEKVGQKGPATQYLALRISDPGLRQVVITIVQTNSSAVDFLRSFKKERLTLMNLRHPNIVSFLDSGTTRDGFPYLVMEHAEGIPIDEYCNSDKLNTHARIKLFLDICDAVQYSHRHFIAHAGINAKRILATKNGIPKLLDLGIAGLLNQELHARGGLTAALNQRELEYVSPEQIRGEPITTSDDVYSLGVLLYHLLTGHSPYRMSDGKEDDLVPSIFEAIKPSKVLDQVVEEPGRGGKEVPITPHLLMSQRNEPIAAMRRILAGDLDSIILKAIPRDPSKRYTSVEQLSGDLRRYLEGLPVSARKNTFLYRASKFMRRRKLK